MAIKRGSKVSAAYSSASMTDLMFLLLVFLLIATTLITPNALRLTLPKSTNQLKEKAYITVSITPDLEYYVEGTPVAPAEVEGILQGILDGKKNPVVALQCDQSVPIGEVVKVMNIAKRNEYQLILPTTPE